MGYLRQNQIDQIENEKSVILRTLQRREVQDRGNLNSHVSRIDKQLLKQAPPDLNGEQRDQAVRENSEIEARLVPLMPSDEEMRRNGPGVVGRLNKFDKASKSKKYFKKGDIFQWKDNRLALHKGDNDPDVANFEILRPLHNMGSMLGAQIPGTQYHGTNPTEAFKEGWVRTFGPDGKEVTSIGASAAQAETVVDPPEKRRVRKPAKATTRKKNGAAKRTRAANKNPVVKTAMACGFMMGPSGRHFHVEACSICQEAAKG
jgi:hypothetical protein